MSDFKKIITFFSIISFGALSYLFAFQESSDIALLEPHSSDLQIPKIQKVESPKNNLAPDFTWIENGKTVKFSEFTKGKFVFLNFWGTWCSPCKKEIPDIIELYNEMQNQNVVVIGIALPPRWDAKTIDKSYLETVQYSKDKKINYPLLFGSVEIIKAFGGIPSVPASFFINNKGEISNTILGSYSKDEFVKEINKMKKNAR